MSFAEVAMWRVICDRCGVSAQADSDYYAWADKDSAHLDAEESNWLVRTGAKDDDGVPVVRHWCEDCVTWDEDLDERVPRTDLS